MSDKQIVGKFKIGDRVAAPGGERELVFIITKLRMHPRLGWCALGRNAIPVPVALLRLTEALTDDERMLQHYQDRRGKSVEDIRYCDEQVQYYSEALLKTKDDIEKEAAG